MASVIQVRVDDKLKTESDNLFKALGTDTTTAIRIFLTQAVAANGFPFEIKRINPAIQQMTEEELLTCLEIARKHEKLGLYKDADSVEEEMRTKYGI